MEGSLTLTGGGRLEVFGTLDSTLPLTVSGATLSGGRIEAPALSVRDAGLVTAPNATTTQVHKLELDIAGTLLVDATSKIDVTGKGYLVGRTSGNTTVGGASNAGGSYGGVGGRPSVSLSSNAVYGDYADPDDWGSGGGGNNNDSGVGGGLVRISAGVLNLEGQLLADGGGSAGHWYGGSGGGIYVATTTLSGSGSISAAGARLTSVPRAAAVESRSTLRISRGSTWDELPRWEV